MKKTNLFSTLIALMLVWFAMPNAVSAQKDPKFDYPTLERQLTQEYHGEKVQPESELARLIARNQEFEMLRADEFSDKRGLPPWLRVWWRKAHPEAVYTAEDPTMGYPLVLKEILEWMMSHQDLKPGPGKSNDAEGGISFVDMLVGTNIRTSGAQTVPRSESYIQINFFNPLQILVGSNNIGGSGQQGIYRSADGGVTWAQSTLPFAPGDTSHSDPTVDFTSDGRAWSSTLGIVGGTLRLRNYFSTDNGATWTFEGTPSGSQTSVDKQIVWIDKSATSPFFGQTYAIWHNGNPAFVNRRTAGAGGTWLAAPIQVSGAESTGTAIGADIRSNSVGEVFGFWPTTSNRKIFMIKSTDGGNTYAAPVEVATTFDGFDIGIPSFNSRRAFIYVSGGGYRTMAKNMVYASWTDLSGETGCTSAANEPGTNVASTCKMRVWFSRSTNGGATWSAPVKINNPATNNDQFSQWLAIDDTNGNLVMIYNDTVADPGRKKSDIWYQASYDDGATWTTAEKVTTAMTDETIAGADSGNQYGDYNGLSGYANSFFPSWTDRRNNAREEIWTALISLGPPPPPAPIIQSAGNAIVSENGIPANNAPDPGETLSVSLALQNIGNLDSTTVTATLQPTGGVTNPGAPQNYNVLTQGGPAVIRNHNFTVDPGAACGSSITLTWVVQDGANPSFNVTETYSVGTPAVSLTQNFDGVTAPALPAGWTQNQTSGTGITWVTSTTTPNSAPNVAFANDPATVNATAIESPVFPVTTANASLLFQKAFTTESTFDGVVLEIKIGAGTWTDIVTAGGVFVSGGYNATISTQFSSPIGGRQAWSGTSASFSPTQVTLPAAANGQNVQVRWLMASDSSVASTGFRLDDVQVQAGSVCATVPGSVRSRADFDGDGKTDISIFRPSEGNWYLNRSTAGFGVINWGVATDTTVPGDYDGDGKADTAIFRPANDPASSDYYILKSNGFVYQGFSWGVVGDVPVTGDYDGDGKSDLAIFRPSSNTWYILNSGNGSNTVAPFGSTGDVPLAFDLENDGKTNLAVYRASSNTWYIARNTGVPAQNFEAVPFGSAGDLLVPADYDGDNKDDFAVFRPSNGTWYIRKSSDSTTTFIAWGSNGDVPVPGDYDGDGKDDVAVYRNGIWYVSRSTAGTWIASFGLATDRPLPRSYIP
ncbi:MAG: hypothetical protein KA746_00140 [Pyrinomonadaceae bacterium]|nr:hypothetical protein [Pyrinomonadaceae bacterium]MBP6212569.1 hypothetical protein [Pyrinomonadaceae bacterium]